MELKQAAEHFDGDHRARRELESARHELACLHGLAEAIRSEATPPELCRTVVRLLSVAGPVRLTLDGVSYGSEALSGGVRIDLAVNGTARGHIEAALGTSIALLDSTARLLAETLERREAQARLQHDRVRLDAILDSIGEGVVLTDEFDRILLMNRAGAELLGAPDPVPLGGDFIALIDDDEFLDVWLDSAGRERDLVRQELNVTRPNRRALSVSRSRVPGLIDGRAGYLTVLSDVTQEREIEQMKTDFVSAVSHELRTPLTSIKGFAVTLRQKDDIPVDLRRRFLGIIDEEADRLARLIAELLILARIESGRMPLGQEPVDVAGLIAHAVEALQAEAVRRGVRLDAEVPQDLARPLGDREKIRVILVNLLENALKFTPAGGTVSVRASQDANELRLEVQDTGLGIPEADQQRIFERFYRVRRPGRTEAGTGLGLFIVKEMVTLHGGHIDVRSAVDAGSVFTVYLPRTGRRAAAAGTGVQGRERESRS